MILIGEDVLIIFVVFFIVVFLKCVIIEIKFLKFCFYEVIVCFSEWFYLVRIGERYYYKGESYYWKI